jgi:hypothetical protein
LKDETNWITKLKNVTNNSIGFPNRTNIARADDKLIENDRYLLNIIITVCSILLALIVGATILLICYCRIYKKRAAQKKSKKVTSNTSNSSQNRITNNNNQNDNDNYNDVISIISDSNHLGNQQQTRNTDGLDININDHASVYIDIDSPEIDRHVIMESRHINDELPSYNDIFFKNYKNV